MQSASSIEPENSNKIPENQSVLKINSFLQRMWWLVSILSFTIGAMIGAGTVLGINNVLKENSSNSSASELEGGIENTLYPTEFTTETTTTPEGQFTPGVKNNENGCFQDPCVNGKTVCSAIPQENRDPIIDCRCDTDGFLENLASPAPDIGPDGYMNSTNYFISKI